MMYGREKSDSAIVAVKPTNNAVPTRLCHALPSLCPVRALLARVPLGPRPWLHRLRCAGARTASRKATEEGEVHRTPPPHQHRLPADGVLRAQTRCRLWGGWTDVADLRSRP